MFKNSCTVTCKPFKNVVVLSSDLSLLSQACTALNMKQFCKEGIFSLYLKVLTVVNLYMSENVISKGIKDPHHTGCGAS